MNDNIDNNEIRRAIDRLQKEHPARFTFDVTLFDNGIDFTVMQRGIDMVAKKFQDDADINIICEMAKLYIEGVRPMVKPKPKHGEWIRHVDDLFPEESTEECSVCHEEQRITGNDDNFCPNCGADMREGDAE